MTRLVYMPGVCRECGCDEAHACVDPLGNACHWVERDLCSACAPAGVDVDEDLEQLELEDALREANFWSTRIPNGRDGA